MTAAAKVETSASCKLTMSESKKGRYSTIRWYQRRLKARTGKETKPWAENDTTTTTTIGANMKTKEASTLLTLVDNRSGVQIAASEGSAAKTDFGGFGALGGMSGAGGLGGYTRTAEGKVIAAAFMDAFNQMVRSLRDYKAQTVQGQGLGGGGRLQVDGSAGPSETSAPGAKRRHR